MEVPIHLVPGYAHPYRRGPYLTTNTTKDTDDRILMPRSLFNDKRHERY